jgi:hypothetical protein
VKRSSQKTFLLRIDQTTFSSLQRWANDDLRSLNGQIEWVLRQELKKQRRLPGAQ